MKKIKIQCGDHYIELTREEIRHVYQHQDFEYLIEDVASYSKDLELTEDEVKIVNGGLDVIAKRARIYLDKSDGFWDHYWANIAAAIEDIIRESK